MGPLFTLHIAGLCIRTRLTTPITMAVVLFGVASAPDRPHAIEFLIGGSALVIFTCVLAAHEVVRIRLFQRGGVVVREIDLALTGGSPSVLDRTNSPRHEVAAGAGSIAVIALFACAGLLAERTIRADIPHELARLVTIAVAGIAVAQTLPALPLDGGRIVKALFWFLTDDPVSGARGSFIYGSVVAAAVVAAGFLMLGADDPLPFWGFGISVAGLQLVTNATALLRDSIWQSVGGGITLAGADFPLPARVSTTDTLDSVVDKLIDEGHHVALLVITENGHPAGVIRLSHLRQVRRSDWPGHQANEIMMPIALVPLLDSGISALDALAEIDRSEIGLALTHNALGNPILIDRATLLTHLMPRAASQTRD
jgi:hypothetical protein